MRPTILGILLSLALTGCKKDDDDTGSDTGDTGEEAVFDPEDPGINVTFILGSVEMLGQAIEMATGVFLVTAREDFDPEEEDDVALDTCVVYTEEAPVPECDGEEDCAPEQDCVPDTDDQGAPIAGTEHCETPREPLNVGPMTLEGCNGCPMQLTYNSGQSGAYTTPGGDGSLNAGTLKFNQDYTFSGDGSSEVGLGAFTGSLHLGPKFALTSPPLVTLTFGNGIEVDADADLALAWTGSVSGGELRISLSGTSMGGDSGSISCRVRDDGAFTIPADMVIAAKLGSTAFFNMFTVERTDAGSVQGDGVTRHDVEGLMTVLLNVKAI